MKHNLVSHWSLGEYVLPGGGVGGGGVVFVSEAFEFLGMICWLTNDN